VYKDANRCRLQVHGSCGLAIHHAFDAAEAECLGLLSRELGERLAEPVGQFAFLRQFARLRAVGWKLWPLLEVSSDFPVPLALSKAVERAACGAAPEECSPVSNRLAAAKLPGAEEDILQDLLSVVCISQYPVSDQPHGPAVLVKQPLAVDHVKRILIESHGDAFSVTSLGALFYTYIAARTAILLQEMLDRNHWGPSVIPNF